MRWACVLILSISRNEQILPVPPGCVLGPGLYSRKQKLGTTNEPDGENDIESRHSGGGDKKFQVSEIHSVLDGVGG